MTTLGGIESCPRRWALGAADYPELWSGRGYPPRVQLNALSGTVVHLALEVITKAMVKAGCPSLQDPKALQVMKDLGGYTKVVNDCIGRTIERLASSPRVRRILEYAARSLRAQVPELRTRAQTMLCRLRLPRLQVQSPRGGAPKMRGPLTAGTFPELDLRAGRIRWKGKADLLVLSPDTCEITDFKTGAPSEEHQFQLRVYALLWSLDADLNPDRRRVDRLILAYRSGEVEVTAPTESELDALEMLLVARRDAAHQTVSVHPPEARPAPKHCRYCNVRHLCTDYWMPETQRRMVQEGDERAFGDAEVTITGRHGPSSWDARVEVSQDIAAGKPAVVRTSGDLPLRAGARLRLLDAAITIDGEDNSQPVVITFGALSEAYAVV
ncbi:MAG: PD-(D/E)XK nuclease family protein [Myxococcales bacterium]|nr:PD-(D/E)XK nuclease family protein [Myxococcales bacterium]